MRYTYYEMVNNLRREVISIEIEPEPAADDVYYAVDGQLHSHYYIFF